MICLHNRKYAFDCVERRRLGWHEERFDTSLSCVLVDHFCVMKKEMVKGRTVKSGMEKP